MGRIASVHDRWLDWCRGRFGVLLGLVVANYVVLMILPNDEPAVITGTIAVSTTVLFALDAAEASRRVRITARSILILLPVMAVLFFGGVAGTRSIISLLFALVLGMATYVVLRHLLGHETISMNTLSAALAVYVLIGLVFTEVFIAAALFGPAQPFLAQHIAPQRSDFVYLSYVTLTTVGFGDLTPKSDLARTLVITEALAGQIFLVTAVARVVSMFGQQRGGPASAPKDLSD